MGLIHGGNVDSATMLNHPRQDEMENLIFLECEWMVSFMVPVKLRNLSVDLVLEREVES